MRDPSRHLCEVTIRLRPESKRWLHFVFTFPVLSYAHFILVRCLLCLTSNILSHQRAAFLSDSQSTCCTHLHTRGRRGRAKGLGVTSRGAGGGGNLSGEVLVTKNLTLNFITLSYPVCSETQQGLYCSCSALTD